MEDRYNFFLSHAKIDSECVKFAKTLVEEFKKEGYTCFFDEKDIQEGDELHETIKSAISNSDVFIRLFGKNVSVRPWCIRERDWAKQSNLPFVCVIVDLDEEDRKKFANEFSDFLHLDAKDKSLKDILLDNLKKVIKKIT